MSYLSGRHHLSRRAVEEVAETVFEVPISLGTVMALEAETTAALAGAYAEARQAVADAPVKNTDETGWSEKGQRRWLWTAATATAAFFVIHLRRSFTGLRALLGQTITGVVCSDRWTAYSRLPLEQRQVCWAHLKRDFRKLIDRGGPADAIGRMGLEVVECLFADWWACRRGELDREGLQARLDPIVRELQGVLEAGRGCADNEGGDLLRQPPGVVSGAVAVRGDRRRRADEQPCGAGPALGRAVAEECVRLPQRGGLPVRGADADGGPDASVAAATGVGLPIPRDPGPSGRTSPHRNCWAKPQTERLPRRDADLARPRRRMPVRRLRMLELAALARSSAMNVRDAIAAAATARPRSSGPGREFANSGDAPWVLQIIIYGVLIPEHGGDGPRSWSGTMARRGDDRPDR